MSSSPVQTYLARTFDDERYAWARRRVVRRRAVTAEATLLGGLVGAVLVVATLRTGWDTPFFLISTVGMLGFIPLHSVLNLSIRGVLDRSGRSLDEHQQRERDRSLSATEWPRTALAFLAWSGAVTLAATSEHTVLALCLGFLLWFTGGLLTYWHLAWTAADEPPVTDPEF